MSSFLFNDSSCYLLPKGKTFSTNVITPGFPSVATSTDSRVASANLSGLLPRYRVSPRPHGRVVYMSATRC